MVGRVKGVSKSGKTTITIKDRMLLDEIHIIQRSYHLPSLEEALRLLIKIFYNENRIKRILCNELGGVGRGSEAAWRRLLSQYFSDILIINYIIRTYLVQVEENAYVLKDNVCV